MYKININEFDDIAVDFKTMCAIKNIKPKIGQVRRIFKSKQRDRINDQYLSPYKVAEFFNLDAMPAPEADYQPSSWYATHAYIKAMYGETYAKSFTPAGYEYLALAA